MSTEFASWLESKIKYGSVDNEVLKALSIAFLACKLENAAQIIAKEMAVANLITKFKT